MDKKTVFVKTSKGESEVAGTSDVLYGDAKRILHLVDDESTVGEITKRAPPSLRETLDSILQELSDGGFIKDIRAPDNVPQKQIIKMASPAFKIATPSAPGANISAVADLKSQDKVEKKSDLDFSFIDSLTSQSKTEPVSKVKQDEQSSQIEIAARAAKLKAYEEAKVRAKIEVAAKARMAEEAQLKNMADAARLKAGQEALKVRTELEASKAKAEAEVRARIEAEVRIKQEVEAARLKAEREAEKLRLELEAVKARAEMEMKHRLEAEALAKAEVEARMKREAEAELRIRVDAEMRVRSEMEARLKAEALTRQDFTGRDAAKNIPASEEAADQAEKLKQSFVESFGQTKNKLKSSASDFKLDTFAMLGMGEKRGDSAQSKAPVVLPGGGSKVKAAIELRAKKEAEAKRIKAEEESAKLNVEQEKLAKFRTEQDSVRLKAENETYRLKTEQEEARTRAEAEEQKMTNQQTKQWDEAQQRAVIQAQQAEKERLTKQSGETRVKPQQKPLAKVSRKSLPMGKILASLFVLALIAVAGLPYFWPLDEYIAPLEREISLQINQPVHIKKIRLALLPMPRLELHTLSIGNGQELKVGDVVLNFDFSALLASTKSINSMELRNVTVTAASFDKVLVWLQAIGGNEKYPVARMELSAVQVTGDEAKWPPLNGRAEFDAQGKFTKAGLKSENGKFSIELQSIQKGVQLEFGIHESSLPILTNIKFKDLSANGIIENGEIIFSDFFAHIYGGTLVGKVQLGWSNGWKLKGQLNAKSLELQSIFPNYGVTGELYGDVIVSMYGSTLSQLDKDPRMEGSFEAKNGVINKLDIDTLARFGSTQGVPGGRTNFSELSGTYTTNNHDQRFFVNKMIAGAVSGSGVFAVDSNQQLSGKLLIDIKGKTSASVPLRLSGTPVEPLLQPGR